MKQQTQNLFNYNPGRLKPCSPWPWAQGESKSRISVTLREPLDSCPYSVLIILCLPQVHLSLESFDSPCVCLVQIR